MAIQLILTQDIEHLGIAGQVVRVRDGYARNYLMPRGMALLATDGRVKELQHKKRIIEEKQSKEIAALKEIARRIGRVTLEFTVHAGEEGKLFGSVTNSDIHARLTEQGFEIERRRVTLPDPIKQLGEYDVAVRLHREVIPTVKVKVLPAEGTPDLGEDADEDADETESDAESEFE